MTYQKNENEMLVSMLKKSPEGNLERSDDLPPKISSHHEKVSSEVVLHEPVGSSSQGNGDFSRFPKDSEQEGQSDQRLLFEENGEEGSIVSSFGMFWRREEVEWTSRTTLNLPGVQRGGADPVDFSQQIGLYLLYDGREVLYVGRARTRDSTLGGRLYDHTKDRLSARWDRFSWFGFLPVSDNGKLGELPDQYGSDRMIAEIEAILIEALEPRQNRRRGDDFVAFEYLQQEKPNRAPLR